MELVSDFQTSVRKALGEIDPDFEKLPGLVICGSHDPSNAEKQIELITSARQAQIPTLGICWGLQLMLIEYARNVLHIPNATSEEFGVGTPIVIQLPGFVVGGKLIHYQGMDRIESHWHQYAFNVNFDEMFNGLWEMNFSNFILEYARLKAHPYYVGVQFHAEYQSAPGRPHHLLLQFLQICKEHAV